MQHRSENQHTIHPYADNYPHHIYAVSSQDEKDSESNHTIIYIQNQSTRVMIDSRSILNILLKLYLSPNTRLSPPAVSLQPYGSNTIQPLGEFTAITIWGKAGTVTTWIVVDDNALEGEVENILSLSISKRLGILHINKVPPTTTTFQLTTKQALHPTTQIILNEYDEVFNGLGKMNPASKTLHKTRC